MMDKGTEGESKPLTSDELDIIEARAAAATPGPWQVLTEDGVDAAWINAARAEDDLPIALLDYRSGDDNRANAEFIAAARVDIMRMIEALREAQQRIQHLILANNREVEQRVEIKRQLEQAQARHLGGEK